MKFNFFKLIEDKYKTRLSLNRPIVVRLDGKNICKNTELNMLCEEDGGFAYSLKLTAQHLSRKFNTLCLASSDEISIIFLKPELLQCIYKKLDCQKVSSLVAQEVFLIFNNHYSGENIYFDARSFNIPNDKISSYVAYRKASAENVYTIYYAKRLITMKERLGKKSNELNQYLSNISDDFKNRSQHNTIGSFYFDGVELLFDDLKSLDNSNNKIHNELSFIALKKLSASHSVINCDDDSFDDLFI